MAKRELRQLNCTTCGAVFESYQDHGKWPKYCNRKCFHNRTPVEFRPKTVTCQTCNVEFLSYSKNGKHRKYCGKGCWDKAPSTDVVKPCEQCGKPFTRNVSRAAGAKFCSQKCHGAARVGEKGYNFKGGKYTGASGHVYVHTDDGWIAEHRLIAAKILGRELHYWSEPILHINGLLNDNRPENLYVCENHSEMGHILNSYRAPYPVTSNLPNKEQING